MRNILLNKTITFILIVFLVGIITNLTIGSSVREEYIQENNNMDYTKSNINIANEGTEYWALLIAVGVYADNPQQNIPFMLEDIDDLYDLLLKSDWWLEDHIKVITGKNATATNIIEGLKWLDEMEDENDISLVYIATHGSPLLLDIPPFDEDDKHDECLSTYWSFVYSSTLIWDDELNYFLSKLESQGVCLIVDSCFAGGFNDPPYKDKTLNTIKNSENNNYASISDWVNGFIDDLGESGRVILMGCREYETAYTGFTPRIIDGLKGYADNNMDGIVTAEEIFYYTEPRVSLQNPTIYDGYNGELPLITYNFKQDNSGVNDQYTDLSFQIVNNITGMYVENSIICGYITDQATNDPIENARAFVQWKDDNGNTDHNSSRTDSFGYYTLNVAAGQITLNGDATNYFENETDWIHIGENVTLWLNISLIHHPPENSVICGFITDKSTGEPIVDANAYLSWRDGENYYHNDTDTDNYGYYTMNVSTGDIRISTYADKYFVKFLDWFYIGDYEIAWLNISLDPYPPENSVVCGYITDESTGDAIEEANVRLTWIYNNYRLSNDTETDHNGFFFFNVASGKIELRLSQDGYCKVKESYYISDEEILWVNISLYPFPAESSIICGYMLDSDTSEALTDFEFSVEWYDGKGHSLWYHPHVNHDGFFEINLAYGEMYFWIYCEGYKYYRSYRKDISENETHWFNISLEKDLICVDIMKPLNAMYISNRRIIPSSVGVVVGSVDVEAFVHNYFYLPVEVSKVEFYVDNVLKATVDSEPYVWNWNDITFGRHAVKVVAYDSIGNSASDEITVRKLF